MTVCGMDRLGTPRDGAASSESVRCDDGKVRSADPEPMTVRTVPAELVFSPSGAGWQ